MEAKDSILVVDDDRDFLAIICQILEKKGYTVKTAPSAAEAIAAPAAAKPALLLEFLFAEVVFLVNLSYFGFRVRECAVAPDVEAKRVLEQ